MWLLWTTIIDIITAFIPFLIMFNLFERRLLYARTTQKKRKYRAREESTTIYVLLFLLIFDIYCRQFIILSYRFHFQLNIDFLRMGNVMAITVCIWITSSICAALWNDKYNNNKSRTRERASFNKNPPMAVKNANNRSATWDERMAIILMMSIK